MNWKIKKKSNDELRQDFVDATVKQAEFLNVKLPDDKLKWNEERGHYDFGEINWKEFWEVVNGNGPCNKQRLKTRKKSYEEGQWVRDAAMAFSEKKRIKK
jgi:ring-1,2-phenylacetyl-CoA epoxidase subunit PaaA